MALNTHTLTIGKNPETVVEMLETLITSIKKSQAIINCDLQSYLDVNYPYAQHVTIRLKFIPHEEKPNG